MSRKRKALSTLKYGVNFPLHCAVSAHHNTKTQMLLCPVNHMQKHMRIKKRTCMGKTGALVQWIYSIFQSGLRNLEGGIGSLFDPCVTTMGWRPY